MLRKLRRLSKLTPLELLVFCQLFVFALSVRVTVRFLSLPHLIKFFSVSARNPLLRHFPLGHLCRDCRQLTVVSDLAARAVRPEGPCLLRSLLLFWLLKARGEQAELLIGVSKETGLLESHAWIECYGKIVGENDSGPLRFATLLRF